MCGYFRYTEIRKIIRVRDRCADWLAQGNELPGIISKIMIKASNTFLNKILLAKGNAGIFIELSLRGATRRGNP